MLGVAKAGANSLVAHLNEFGEQVERLWRTGKLRLMERGALCEAMVMVSVAAGSSQQTMVQALADRLAAPLFSARRSSLSGCVVVIFIFALLQRARSAAT